MIDQKQLLEQAMIQVCVSWLPDANDYATIYNQAINQLAVLNRAAVAVWRKRGFSLPANLIDDEILELVTNDIIRLETHPDRSVVDFVFKIDDRIIPATLSVSFIH